MLKLTNINYGEQTYDPGKANYTAHSIWRLCYPLPGIAVSAKLCIPFTLNEHEAIGLIMYHRRKKPIQKGQTLFKAGDELKSLYAIARND